MNKDGNKPSIIFIRVDTGPIGNGWKSIQDRTDNIDALIRGFINILNTEWAQVSNDPSIEPETNESILVRETMNQFIAALNLDAIEQIRCRQTHCLN